MANKPKDICISFETAKALLEAGIVVESLYVWHRRKTITVWGANLSTPNWSLSCLGAYTFAESSRLSPNYEMYPASTAEELLEPIKKDFCIKIYLHFNDSVMAETWIMNKPVKEYYFKTKWHEKLCECYAEIRLKLKEAGYGLRK